MTSGCVLEPFSLTETRLKIMLLKAQVTALQWHPTAHGNRLYIVFKTLSQRQLGLWTTLDAPRAAWLRVGDRVLLRDTPSGRLQLALQPLSSTAQLHLFGWMNRAWRAKPERLSQESTAISTSAKSPAPEQTHP